MADVVYVHYQNGARSNTMLVDWIKPGEEWREPGGGWRVAVGTSASISCPGKGSIRVTFATCPESWDTMDLGCSGATGAKLRGYRGTMSTTSCGLPCQNWLGSTYTADDTTGIGNHSQCQNPGGSAGTWCYTDLVAEQWAFCGVCGSIGDCNPVSAMPRTCTCEPDLLLSGQNFRGLLNTTVSGRTCERWDLQTPHAHSYTPATYPRAGLDGNYCRNPDGEPSSWCYAVEGGRWDFCNHCHDPGTTAPMAAPAPTVPPLTTAPTIGCRLEPADGTEYRGTLNRTINGHTCQRWSAQNPNGHVFTPDGYADRGVGDHNHCRKPDDEPGLWCYTVDGPRWDFCGCPADDGGLISCSMYRGNRLLNAPDPDAQYLFLTLL